MTDEIKEEESPEDRQTRIEYQMRMLMLMASVALPGLTISMVVYGNGTLAATANGACPACLRDALSFVVSMHKDAIHLEHDVEGETKH